MTRITVNSSAELDQVVKDNSGKTVVLLFTGTKKSDGNSWCPDCVVADPVIEERVEHNKRADFVFVTVPVGDLPT